MQIYHFNCGLIQPQPDFSVACHCLLLAGASGLALVDTGIGLFDVRDPCGRIGGDVIDQVGFKFREDLTAYRQIERLGFDPVCVANIILTHADPDHAGGLSDFPEALVHLTSEELRAVEKGAERYSAAQFQHQPLWRPVVPSSTDWFGLEAREVPLKLSARVLLVPLFGHTLGHAGVAIEQPDGRWLLHAGDTYYLRGELDSDEHPVSSLSDARAVDAGERRISLNKLRRLRREHGDRIAIVGYHDPAEFVA